MKGSKKFYIEKPKVCKYQWQNVPENKCQYYYYFLDDSTAVFVPYYCCKCLYA